jgi:hypothetical protein
MSSVQPQKFMSKEECFPQDVRDAFIDIVSVILRVGDREQIATRATVRRKCRGKGYETLVFETVRKR